MFLLHKNLPAAVSPVETALSPWTPIAGGGFTRSLPPRDQSRTLPTFRRGIATKGFRALWKPRPRGAFTAPLWNPIEPACAAGPAPTFRRWMTAKAAALDAHL